jgi:acetyl/propionyl-CoA carboxylase alpha subunit
VADSHRLLIANRGEIAVRIARAAAAEGMTSVAVAAADEPDAAHLAAADESYVLPGSGPAAYLDAAEIVKAAIATNCRLLHPGYGFLSESRDLPEACEDAGIRRGLRLLFVGPSPAALVVLGDKVLARGLAEKAGIPVLEGLGVQVDVPVVESLMEEAGAVMLKPRFGGGGRGTRIVRRGDDVAAAIRGATADARAAFGDPTLLAEAFLDRARHIEVQVLGDRTGGVVVLGDRDCSLQRSRQKIVEIAPAPNLPAHVREQLHRAAGNLIERVGLHGLATVEFLVSADDPERFVFLECNPRLQVEHTVTEETTGLDLVRLQLRVATGATLADLGLADGAPRPLGWAVQARVNGPSPRLPCQADPASGSTPRPAPALSRARATTRCWRRWWSTSDRSSVTPSATSGGH